MDVKLYLYNTLTKRKEKFIPLSDKKVGLYTCGPTVYWYAHLGNLRTYIFEDILKRVLQYNGFKVKHIMNITDVGHLTSDQDIGEDKIELAALKEKKSPLEIAKFYTKAFKRDLKRLNILEPNKWTKATDYIKEMIEWIKKLEKRGYTYETDEVVYFNTSKLSDYGKLVGKKHLEGLKKGARIEIDPKKKNPLDFALWFKTVGKHKKHLMRWQSPWGVGFPGWHIECTVMSIKNLGETFDIHCGGIDHIPIHHTNEIAQAEAVTGKPFVRYWLHGEFLVLPGKRMGKSEKNIILLQDVIDKGFNPLSFRYLCLETHYQSKLEFSWKSLESANNALKNLYYRLADFEKRGKINIIYQKQFIQAINDNLNIPKALSLVWKLLKDNKIKNSDKLATIINFDKVLGLKIKETIQEIKRIPKKIKKLIQKRNKLRKENKFKQADEIRKRIKALGYLVEDKKEKTIIKKMI